MKIYTGGGDKGKTSLFSGERVPKHHLRIEAYGDIDELNSLLGAVTSYLPATEQAVRNDLDLIQSNLFMAGAWLATTPDSSATAYLLPFSPEHAKGLEARIDAGTQRVHPAGRTAGGSLVACGAYGLPTLRTPPDGTY